MALTWFRSSSKFDEFFLKVKRILFSISSFESISLLMKLDFSSIKSWQFSSAIFLINPNLMVLSKEILSDILSISFNASQLNLSKE